MENQGSQHLGKYLQRRHMEREGMGMIVVSHTSPGKNGDHQQHSVRLTSTDLVPLSRLDSSSDSLTARNGRLFSVRFHATDRIRSNHILSALSSSIHRQSASSHLPYGVSTARSLTNIKILSRLSWQSEKICSPSDKFNA